MYATIEARLNWSDGAGGGIEKQGQADLHKQLLGERKKRTRLTEVVDIWKEKYIELDKIEVDKEDKTRDMIRNMNKEMGDKRRAIRILEKRVESVDVCNLMAVERLENVRNDLENKLQQRNKDVAQLEMQSSAVCCRPPQPYLSIWSYSLSPLVKWGTERKEAKWHQGSWRGETTSCESEGKDEQHQTEDETTKIFEGCT